MQVKEDNGNYICLKHNQMILLVAMDNRVPLENKMLCNICMSENRLPLNQVLSVQQAQEMIREKLTQSNAGQEERTSKQIGKLKSLQQNMIELQSQLLTNIDVITRMIEQWTEELSKSIKNEQIDLIKELKLLQQVQGQSNLMEQNNKTYLMKIYSAFKRLLIIDGFQKCYEDLKKLETNDEQIEQPIKIIEQSNQSQQVIDQQLGQISYQMINQIKQEEGCQAIAFNNNGSIMVAGFKNDIKVWSFEQGKIKELNQLEGGSWIRCLLFSKKYQWFVSGNGGGNFKSWKQGNNNSEWLCNQAQNKHKDQINCIILTKNEDQLISCSTDKSIIVWSVKYDINQIEYQYSLDNKHTHYVYGVSLNQSETTLVSCGQDKQLILWVKGEEDKWIYQHSVKLDNYLSRVCFFGEKQILLQKSGEAFTNVLEVVNKELKVQQNLQIKLNIPKQDSDCCLFPTIYNKRKDIIIQKSHRYVYIIRKQANGSFKVEAEPIDCETRSNYGTLTEDGEYLVIWNSETKEFRVYKISYG